MAVATIGFVLSAIGALSPDVPVSAVNHPQATVVSADPADTTPQVLDGRVYGIAEIDSRVVVGGTFTQVKNFNNSTVHTRNRVFAYDKTTGVIDQNFVPNVDNVVNDVEAGPGDTVYLAGAFATVNGVASKGLAKLNTTNGSQVEAFSAPTTGTVEDIVLRGGKLYAGGAFPRVKGVVRGKLAAVDGTTGAVDPELNLPLTEPIVGSTSVKQLDVTPDGSRLVVTGNFKKVNGVARHQVALIDLTTVPDSVSTWDTLRFTPRCSTSYDTYMRGVDFSPDGSYFVIVTTGAPFDNTLCDSASRWETGATGPNREPTWVNWTGGDTLYSVAVTNVAVYVGGHQRWLNNSPVAHDVKRDGAVDRSGIGALDPTSGVPLRWNPGRTRGVGAFVLTATAGGLYVGSDTTSLGGEFHARLGFFPLAGGTANDAPRPATLPADLFVLQGNGTMDRRSFSGSTFGPTSPPVSGPAIDGIDWTLVRGSFMVNGRLFTIHTDGTMRAWTWDGTRFVNPVNQSPWVSFASSTAMGYSGGKVFYTSARDSRLFWRWFSIESGLVGAEQYIADPGAGKGDAGWNDATGVTFAGGKIYTSHSSGNLTRTDTDVAGLPVPGTTVNISGPGVGDGRDWNVVDLFIFSP